MKKTIENIYSIRFILVPQNICAYIYNICFLFDFDKEVIFFYSSKKNRLRIFLKMMDFRNLTNKLSMSKIQ